MNKVKKYSEFINEHKNNVSQFWNNLMDRYDMEYYTEFQKLSKDELEEIRNKYVELRKMALNKLNQELNFFSDKGKVMNIDVSDEELYQHLNLKDRKLFFKYSRILDFQDGYKPKELTIIKKEPIIIRSKKNDLFFIRIEFDKKGIVKNIENDWDVKLPEWYGCDINKIEVNNWIRESEPYFYIQ